MFIDLLLLYVLLGAAISVVLLVWFDTSAFVEYMQLFGMGAYLHIDEYVTMTQDDPSTTYPQYLAQTYNSFLTRLLSCPACLGAQLGLWINIPLFVVFHSLTSWYSWTLLPLSMLVTIYFGLLMYYLLVRLMK